ncbi:MAG: hypothetical protein HY913_12790 [Desulfomonile tiedjei]|nr:hypothetical protein [Desulfomonile tiedjei]
MVVLLFDVLSVIGVIAVAYLVYKKFFASPPAEDKTRQTAYEEGFSDAIRYFGLRKLYKEDAALEQRMNSVFGEAGINHRIDGILDRVQDKPAGPPSKPRSKEKSGKA